MSYEAAFNIPYFFFTLNASITIEADDIFKYFLLIFQRK